MDWVYPKEAFEWYTSAEIHTHNRQIPRKLIFLGSIAALSLIGASVAGFYWFKKLGSKEAIQQTIGGHAPGQAAQDGPGQAAGGGGSTVAHQEKRPMTRTEYLATLAPRVEGFPQTASRYDELNKPVVAPKPVACVKSAAKGCLCNSQQATPVLVPLDVCAQIVDHGWFDDTQGPVQANGPVQDQQQPMQPTQVASAGGRVSVHAVERLDGVHAPTTDEMATAPWPGGGAGRQDDGRRKNP